MEIAKTVADNLKRLMQYAIDHSIEDWPRSDNALAKLTKLGRGTVQRALGKGAPTAIAIDTLEALASAYGVQAWQLLIPDWAPSNPPTVMLTTIEKQLHERLLEVQRGANLQSAQGTDRSPSGNRKGQADRARRNPKAKRIKAPT